MLRQAANDVLRNDVMLRINDVALRAKGKLHLHPDKKILDFKGILVFLRVKNTPISPLHLFPTFWP